MKIKFGKVKEDFSRDTFWSHISIKSEENKYTDIYTCASFEYLSGVFKTMEIDNKNLLQWQNKVAERWQLQGDMIFKNPVHYDVYAVTREGVENGLEFLRHVNK
jgi:hypothetical protein